MASLAFAPVLSNTLPSERAVWLAGVLLALAGGCGGGTSERSPVPMGPAPETSAKAERAAARKQAKKPWNRPVPEMPADFVPFPAPDLHTFEGVWLIDSEVSGEREVWVVGAPSEVGSSPLSIVDRHSRVREYGLSLLSPCSLRLLDEQGHAHKRAMVSIDGVPSVTHTGAVAVMAKDDSQLVCVGRHHYVIDAAGECRRHAEMLGSWDSDVVGAEHCARTEAGLSIDGATLSPLPGQGRIALDPIAANAAARSFPSREQAEAALQAAPDSTEPVAATETSGTTTGTLSTSD